MLKKLQNTANKELYMATKSRIVEPSFRIGSGRYIQESGALYGLAGEITKLGCKKPFIIGGETAFLVAKDRIDKSLEGWQAIFYVYKGFCDLEHCTEICELEGFKDCDVVVGVGGGNVMDAAKLCAALSGRPVINVPTSSATCAAYTPLSVTYNSAGQTMGTKHHSCEVNAVIVDMEILCKQPVRLLVAGVYDSLAKLIEINQRLYGKDESEIDIGLLSSYSLSKFVYDKLLALLPEACEDIGAQRNTKVVYDVVYLIIAVTGVISGLARGSNQCAIAHKLYESARYIFPKIVYPYLHGELVAIGLLCQLAYNGDLGGAEEFRRQMKALSMPTSLSEIGIEPSDENFTLIYDKIASSTAMAGTGDDEKARLFKILNSIR